MAIQKRNFTVSPGRNTIVLRRCSPGGSFGLMELKPIYGQSYSLALQYPEGSFPAQAVSGLEGAEPQGSPPDIVDLKAVEDADPPLLWVNSLASVSVDKVPGVPEEGKKTVWLGFSGSFNIQAGSPFRKPRPVPAEDNSYYSSQRLSGGTVVGDTIYVWDIEIDEESPGSAVIVSGISGVVDPDDPLKYRYVVPIPTSSTPEWAPGGQPLAYKYKLGGFMEGTIRINLSGGGGGGSQSPVCGATVE